MTREEAIERLNRCREILEFTSHMDAQTRKAFDMVIKALEQDFILDKVRAEIEVLSNANPSYWHGGDMVDRDDVLEIIDKYKESEE